MIFDFKYVIWRITDWKQLVKLLQLFFIVNYEVFVIILTNNAYCVVLKHKNKNIITLKKDKDRNNDDDNKYDDDNDNNRKK